jgi:gluconokinase
MIIVLMGVTGAGKTTVGNLLAQQLGWTFYDADDFHSPSNKDKMRRGEPLTDADRLPWLETLRDLIRSKIDASEDAVLACSALKSAYRDYLLIDQEVRLVYLKGTRSLIRSRLERRRGHYMNPNLLESQFETLEEPIEAVAVEVDGSPEDIARCIRSRLGI